MSIFCSMNGKFKSFTISQTNIFFNTLVSEHRVLTAQYCLAHRLPSSTAVVVGEHDVNIGSETLYTAIYNIEFFVCFTDCNTYTTNQNDIALIKTTRPIRMNPGVGIACLPFKYNTNTTSQFAGDIVVVAGWGTLEFAGFKSNILQKVQLTVTSQAKCQDAVGYINNNNICTFTPDKDVCQFDNGGGLWWTGPDNGRLYVIGVSSFNSHCAGPNPTESTRVTQYLNWITDNSPESNYCQDI